MFQDIELAIAVDAWVVEDARVEGHFATMIEILLFGFQRCGPGGEPVPNSKLRDEEVWCFHSEVEVDAADELGMRST